MYIHPCMCLNKSSDHLEYLLDGVAVGSGSLVKSFVQHKCPCKKPFHVDPSNSGQDNSVQTKLMD